MDPVAFGTEGRVNVHAQDGSLGAPSRISMRRKAGIRYALSGHCFEFEVMILYAHLCKAFQRINSLPSISKIEG